MNRTYRAICFDLDGTLLPMDIDLFMSSYFKRIAAYAAAHGLDPELFVTAVRGGVRAMAMSDDERLNSEVFWEEFARIYGDTPHGDTPHGDTPSIDDIRAIANAFYEEDFGHIGDGIQPNPAAARAINVLREKGYPLVLATMPMFPLRAVKHRLEWAGIDPDNFARITHYENSRTTKPRQTYYAENLAAMGLKGEDVLMVGNNTMEDLSFMDLGADAWLVTDWLLDPVHFDIESVKHGSMEDFANWCESLPECENPAGEIERDAADLAACERAFVENAVRDITASEVKAKAQALATAIEEDRPLGK